MNKPLTKEQRIESEEARYKERHHFETKELVARIPDDPKKELVFQCENQATAVSVRMALYNLRRSVRSFKYFKPDIRDKITRLTASVQGATLVLRLRPSERFDANIAAVVEGAIIRDRPAVNPDPAGGDSELRRLVEEVSDAVFEEEQKPEPQPDPDEGFEFPIRKK